TDLFDTADSQTREAKEATANSGDPAHLRLDTVTRQIIPALDEKLANDDKFLLSKARGSLQTSEELAAWGAAQARAGKNAEAISALEEAISKEPKMEYKELLAKVFLAEKRPADADALLEKLPISESNLVSALYLKPPKGFQDAILYGELLMRRQKPSSSLHV